jgi:hypothetical protein
MSNLIFPSFTATNGGPAWPVKKTPSFRTIVQIPANNRGENRISLTPYSIWKFELAFELLKGDYATASALQTLAGFMGQVGGANLDWLYDDPYDDTVTQAMGVFGYGDGATTQFQLQRQVGSLNDIVQNLKGAPSIYVGGTLQTPFAGTGSAALYWIGQENLLLQSAAFNLSPWALTNSGASNPTVTANSTTAPDGTATADTIAFPSTVSGPGESIIYQLFPSGINAQGAQFTFSIWLKCASGTQQVSLNVGGWVSGAVTLVTVTTTWTRYYVTGTFDLLQNGNFAVIISTYNQVAQTVYAWGAQLERSPAATGYLPTTTAQNIPNGIVTFATAPAASSKLTWTGGFYFRCRFEEDEWADLQEFLYQHWEMSSLKFRSVIL